MILGARNTTRDLRRRNRAMLLSLLYHHGAASRVELARASGLSSGSVSNVAGDLVEAGTVVEVGLVDSDGGRPRTLLQVRPEHGTVVGVAIGETNIRVGLFDWTLTRLAATTVATEASLAPASIVRGVLAGIATVTAEAGVDPAGLLGVGVGVPGAIRPVGDGTAVHAPTLGWSGVRLDELLKQGITVPLYLDNVARTLGQAEMWRGAGRGSSRSVVALLGVGVGAALVTGPDSLEATSSTCELGHTVIVVGGAPCRCGSRGCLETYVGAEAILARYDGPLAADGTEARLAELVKLAQKGQKATKTLEDAAEYLGIGIANLVNLISPDRVVLAGWGADIIGAHILPAVRSAAHRHTLPYLREGLQIQLGELGEDAVTLGAATLPVMQVLNQG